MSIREHALNILLDLVPRVIAELITELADLERFIYAAVRNDGALYPLEVVDTTSTVSLHVHSIDYIYGQPTGQSVASSTSIYFMTLNPETTVTPYTCTLTYAINMHTRLVERIGTSSCIDVGCGIFNDHLYLVGGVENKTGQPTNQVVKFNETWSTITPMRYPRTNPAVITVNSRLYVIGGHASDIMIGTSMEVFDGVKWTLHPEMMVVPRVNAGVVRYNHLIIVIGGMTQKKHEMCATSTVEAYNMLTTQWSFLAPLPCPYASPRPVIYQGRVVCQGRNMPWSWYDYDRNIWEQMQDYHLILARHGHFYLKC